MKTSDFFFKIPEHLIAQRPATVRGTSRLLVIRREADRIEHTRIDKLAGYVEPETIVVINDTRVRKARLFGRAKNTGGRVEFILLEELRPGLWKVLAEKSKKQREGKEFRFPGAVEAVIREGPELKCLEFHPPIDEAYLESHGSIPLPPYIKREPGPDDNNRYQTVYGRRLGSAAAPTAGLHLTEEILGSLKERGIRIVAVTLHVGPGTFVPVRTDEVEEHTMHQERYRIPSETSRIINEALRDGRKILAVGTTVVRALEAAWSKDGIAAGEGKTDIFIYPGYRFKVVSQLLTNFHTPRSTLLILVSALAGRQKILKVYNEAVRKGYRFFSYGDAMLIL